jgi:hypothetical protein
MNEPANAYLQAWNQLPTSQTDFCKNKPEEVLQMHLLQVITLDSYQLATAIKHSPEMAARYHKELKLSRKSRESLVRESPFLGLTWFPELLTCYEVQSALKACRPYEIKEILKNKRTLHVLNACKPFVPHHLEADVKTAIMNELHTVQYETPDPEEIDIDFAYEEPE